jgi:hypothetical protein
VRLSDVQTQCSQAFGFFFGAAQADCADHSVVERRLEQRSIAAADVDQSVMRLDREFCQDSPVDELGEHVVASLCRITRGCLSLALRTQQIVDQERLHLEDREQSADGCAILRCNTLQEVV